MSGTETGYGPREATLGQKLDYEIGEAAWCPGKHMTVKWEAVAFNLSVETYQLILGRHFTSWGTAENSS